MKDEQFEQKIESISQDNIDLKKISLPVPSLRKKKMSRSKKLFFILIIIFLFIISFSIITKRNKSSASSTQRIVIQQAKATMKIEKEFLFPLKDNSGKKVTDIKYIVESAEKRDEIIIKEKRARAIQGRTFLIFTVKIVNPYDKPIEINARNYMRISVNGKTDELLAPDIHNDPVVVQPISTKYTRLGLPINESDTNIAVHVGEIKEDKETIALSF